MNNKEKNEKKDKKDFWDISKIVVTLLFTTIGGAIGGTFTGLTNYYFRQQELDIKRVETVEKFMPYLVGEINGQTIPNAQAAKENTIIVIASLGHEELAINLARLNPSYTSILILKKIILKSMPLDTHPKNNNAKATDRALEAVDAIGEIAKAKIDLASESTAVLQNINKLYLMQSEELASKAMDVLQGVTPFAHNRYPEATSIKKWAIVISSDTNLEGAKYEKDQALKKQKSQIDKVLKEGDVNIYKRKEFYATVVEGINESNKVKTLNFWQKEFRPRPSSFVIDFNDWCKKKSDDKGGYFECE